MARRLVAVNVPSPVGFTLEQACLGLYYPSFGLASDLVRRMIR